MRWLLLFLSFAYDWKCIIMARVSKSDMNEAFQWKYLIERVKNPIRSDTTVFMCEAILTFKLHEALISKKRLSCQKVWVNTVTVFPPCLLPARGCDPLYERINKQHVLMDCSRCTKRDDFVVMNIIHRIVSSGSLRLCAYRLDFIG